MSLQIPPPPPRSGPVLDKQGHFQLTTWSGWFRTLFNAFNTSATAISAVQTQIAAGQSVTVPLAALTGGGTNGSLTFVNGILTSHVNPT